CWVVTPGSKRQRLHHFSQAPAPLLCGLVVMIDPNNGEPIRKLAGLHQMEERRYDEAFGQIPPSAEDDHSCRVWLAAPYVLWQDPCGFVRGGCHRTHRLT